VRLAVSPENDVLPTLWDPVFNNGTVNSPAPPDTSFYSLLHLVNRLSRFEPMIVSPLTVRPVSEILSSNPAFFRFQAISPRKPLVCSWSCCTDTPL